MSPFAGMTWEECIKKNQDKGDPEAYCGKIKHQVEDAIPNCVFARMDCLEKKYPKMFTIAEKLTLAHDFCSFNSTQEDFGNGDLFRYVEDLLGSKKIKKVAEYRKIKEAWALIRTIGAPTLIDNETGAIYEGKLYLKDIKFDFDVNDAKPYYGTKIGTGETSAEKALKKSQEAYEARKQGGGMGNRPWTPVMSSTVMGYSIKDSNLYLRFHSSPNNAYKYPLGSNEEAHTAANEMTEDSPGRFVWKFFRGHEKGEPTGIENVPEKYGRVAGNPNRMTIGGIGSEGYQQHPYEKLSRAIEGIEEVPQFEKLAKQMRQFKMGVKGEEVPEEEREKGELEAGGTSGAPFRPGEIEKYQKKIYEEKTKRKGIHEEVKGEIEKLRKKRLKRDFDESKGRWVTIKGRHIFIEKGKKVQFSSEGRYKVVSGKEYKEKKEERIRKKIEKTGYERERAEQSIKEKREKRKKEIGYKKEPKPPSKETQNKIRRKQEAIRTRTNKLRELSKGKSWGTIINELLVLTNNIVKEAYSKKGAGGLISFAKYIDKIRKDKRISNEKKSKLISQINKLRSEIIALQPKQTSDTISELREWVEKNITLRGGWTVENVMWAIVNSRKKKESWKETWNRVGSIFDVQREKRKKQKEDFETLNEIIELEKELKKYDFHLEDHFDEFYDYIGGIKNE